MRKLHKIYYVIASMLIVGLSWAQTSELDSLKKQLLKCANDSCKADILCEMGKIQCNELDFASAFRSGKMAESISRKSNYKKGLALSLHLVGRVYLMEGNYPEALDYHLRSLTIKKELGDERGIAFSYNNIGVIYNGIHDYDKSLDYYKRSVEIKNKLLRKAIEAKDEKEIRNMMLSVAGSSTSIGNTFDDMKRFDEAIMYYKAAQKVHEKYNNRPGIEGCDENIGVAYFHKQNYEKALEQFMKVYQNRTLDGDDHLLAGTFLNIGKSYVYLNKPEKAKPFLEKSLKLSREIGMTDVTRDSYLGLYELESDKKNYKEAFGFYKRYVKYRDSISNESVTKKMTRLELNFDHQAKEKQAILAQEKKDAVDREKSKFQMVIIISMAVLLVIVVAFGAYAAVNYRQKQKINALITQQKNIIEEKQTEIIASINYAKRIQTILITSENYIHKELNRLNKN